MANKPAIGKVRLSGKKQKVVTIPSDDEDIKVGDWVEIKTVEFH